MLPDSADEQGFGVQSPDLSNHGYVQVCLVEDAELVSVQGLRARDLLPSRDGLRLRRWRRRNWPLPRRVLNDPRGHPHRKVWVEPPCVVQHEERMEPRPRRSIPMLRREHRLVWGLGEPSL